MPVVCDLVGNVGYLVLLIVVLTRPTHKKT